MRLVVVAARDKLCSIIKVRAAGIKCYERCYNKTCFHALLWAIHKGRALCSP